MDSSRPSASRPVGDLYYIYQHEKIGVFRVMAKLKEIFHAGTVRLSTGQSAFFHQLAAQWAITSHRVGRSGSSRRVQRGDAGH